ncbi:MAG: hypothetical protein U1E65_18885 [Myxococcota bacterium]
MKLARLSLFGLLFAFGCDCGGNLDNGRGYRAGQDARGQTDTSSIAEDAATEPSDSGAELDAGGEDTLGTADSGQPFFFDAMAQDTGVIGPQDTGVIGPQDTGVIGPQDTGVIGPPDSGVIGPPDSGVLIPPDSGVITPGNNDIWVEIDYSSASSPRSPSWRFSNTPGWGAAQWAAVNASNPEAWDRFNNMQVVNDPIGRSLEIGGGSELQLMIGLEELISYDAAYVHIEGRSRATSSSVDFDVFNPWNGCGSAATFGQQWTVQPANLDLMQCYEIGQGVQAVRVSPTNGTVALVRLRLTLTNARW